MVLGHTRSPFTSFIYLFHMAVFFMVTGYLWNGDKYVSISGGGQYVLKKLKALWIPFFAGNAIFVLLNNEFVNVGIYADNNLPGQIADTYQILSINSIYYFFDIV